MNDFNDFNESMREVLKKILRCGLFSRFICWNGPRHGNRVALTFDDGPNGHTTPEVLEILDRAGVRATFFVLGEYVREYPAVVCEIVARGHELGIHGFDHGRGRLLRQVRLCVEALREATGVSPRLVRPPRGELSLPAMPWLGVHGYRVVMWSMDAQDSMRHDGKREGPGPDYAALNPGDIVLMHDDNPVCVEELPRLIKTAKQKGLRAVTVSELLA